MLLSHSAISELAIQRDSLIKEKADIEARLEAINLLIGRARLSNHARPKTRKIKSTQIASKAVTPGASLRGAIKQALSGIAVDMKPGDIIRKLKTSGFQIHGKTPYETRVYNELKRMVREGLLVRNAQRQYALKR